MRITCKTRALIVCCALAAGFTTFSYRLVVLQVTRHDFYAAKAAEIHGLKLKLYAKRGAITDIRGTPLAQSIPVKTVVADGAIIKDREALAAAIAGPLEMTMDEVLKKLQRTKTSDKTGKIIPMRYIVLKKNVSESAAAKLTVALEKTKEHAIFYEQDSVRVYPNNELACHVVGKVDHDGDGLEGIEKSMEAQLRGFEGFRLTERDRTGHEMGLFQQAQRDPQDGANVRLTIDHQIQMIVEAELDAACKKYKPKMAVSIMMRPQTGEILAMANRPAFNLNNPDEIFGDYAPKEKPEPREPWKHGKEKAPPEEQGPRTNRAVMSMVEPGSTFKIVTVAAALSEKCVRPDTTVYCENGAYTYFGQTLHDHKHYGDLTVEDILAKSSNVGVAKLGIQLGDQRLYKYIRKFGFGERTGVLLPGEIGGMVHPWNDWKKTSITHVPMGHEVGVTPLQITTAMCVMANGGNLLVPQIVHDVTANDGTVIRGFQPVEMRRVISAQTAAEVRAALMKVTMKGGTATLAQVPGFKVAGKTGTAQKVGPNGGYEHGKYVVSFVGFMPAEKPEFVCLVMLDDAHTEAGLNYGGQVAAPIFSRIADQTARYLNLTPTEPILQLTSKESDARD
jgi:cell division protein FtsI (penicillin-binding protein 3)/stage V sporulation protein D (sporulation-specific penicillin-binding protein)